MFGKSYVITPALVVIAFISDSTVSDVTLKSSLASTISCGTSVPLSAFLIMYQSVFASSLPILCLKLVIACSFNSLKDLSNDLLDLSFLNTVAPVSQYISPKSCILSS